jgi:hypothetical protein
MTDEDIAVYGYLWSEQAKDLFLLVALSEDTVDPEQCLIYSMADQTVMRICDDQLAEEVNKRMAADGVHVTLSLPWA